MGMGPGVLNELDRDHVFQINNNNQNPKFLLLPLSFTMIHRGLRDKITELQTLLALSL